MTSRQRLSEAEVAHHLERLFADVLAVQEQLDADTLFPPLQRGSVLENDDAKTDPYQLSHGVRQGVSVAVDHLHALAALVGQQKMLHASPPFSLVRCSIESAATAYWLLAHPKQPDRLARRFRHAAQDARDADEAAKDMGLEPPKPLTKRLSEIQAQANTVVGRPTSLKPLKYTDLLGSVDAAVGTGARFRATWRTCSGFAHGRLWAPAAPAGGLQTAFSGLTSRRPRRSHSRAKQPPAALWVGPTCR